MKRNLFIVAVLLLGLLGALYGVAIAQSKIGLPVIINDEEGSESDVSFSVRSALAASYSLANGDTVRCASGSYLSFSWSADHKTATARCTAVATSTPLPATATNTPAAATDTPTNTPTATGTNTPTNTPASTSSATPAATNTPTGGSTIAPYAAAPSCPSHNDQQWHSVWDAQRGCHYDHEHGDSPALADALFGPLGQFWPGQSPIMLPWGMANEKTASAHGGYKVEVALNLPNRPAQCWYYDGCVTDIRAVTHFGPKGGVMPDHSFWVEARVQNQDGSYGIVRTGGTWVTGILHSPYKDTWVNIGALEPPGQGLQAHPNVDADYGPDGQPNQNLSVDPYRAHQSCANFARFGEAYSSKSAERTLDPNQIGWRNTHFWIMHDNLPTQTGGRLYGMTPFVHLAQSIGDGSSCVEANGHIFVREPFVNELMPQNCPLLANGALGCRYNNSNGPILFDIDLVFGGWMSWIDNSQWDTDGRVGWLNINTFVKPVLRNPDGSVIAGRPDPRRFFTEAAGCTMTMMDCVPLVVTNVRVGIYNWTTPDGAGFWKPVDHDVNLPNVWWLGTGN